MRIAALSLALAASAAHAQVMPVINEFVADHTSTDTNEFVEIFGTPNTNYSNLWIVEIEGDGSSAGLIDDFIFQLGTTDANGFWTTPFQNNVLENDNITLLLVAGFFGSVGDDIDTNNDGVIDSIFWASIIDDVASKDATVAGLTYSTSTLDQNLTPAGSFAPGGASRLPNGVDTNTPADWHRNHFNGAGLPAFPGVIPDSGNAWNTPGTFNKIPAPGALALVTLAGLVSLPRRR